ncbi:MAG: dihydropteroate synthase, partial [Gammaproteobacteria bacterium]|nr:dihydropteroate synthase [Gammaproteobacteria bacterium]
MTDLDLRSTKRPWVMGILNITPDSFADGGKFLSVENALTQARQMIADGADIIDIGGESTRPGAEAVNSDEELDRVIPIIEAIRNESTIPISIDTSKPSVMQAAAEAGVNLINDVNALRAD